MGCCLVGQRASTFSPHALAALLGIGLELRLESRKFCKRRIRIRRFFPLPPLEASRLARLPIAFARRTIALLAVEALLWPMLVWSMLVWSMLVWPMTAMVTLMPSRFVVGIACGLRFGW